jgi:hypothetical protein
MFIAMISKETFYRVSDGSEEELPHKTVSVKESELLGAALRFVEKHSTSTQRDRVHNVHDHYEDTFWSVFDKLRPLRPRAADLAFRSSL